MPKKMKIKTVRGRLHYFILAKYLMIVVRVRLVLIV